MSKLLCIYHTNCADGFGAAWAVRQRFGEENVEFYPGTYQQDPPDVKDREVLIVDFSYKRPVLLQMAWQATGITILDHHKSALEDLQNIEQEVAEGDGCPIAVHFDMQRSGAMITWDWCFPNQEPPQLLKHIQDRDLWRFDLLGTREIQATLFSYPYDFEVWDELMAKDTQALIEEGRAIERKHFKDINELIRSAADRSMIAGYDVPVLNAPYFYSSDAGHIMAKDELFAACYWFTPNGVQFSLRSAPDGLDVSAIATKFGGGGHKHAAGFKVGLSDAEMEKVRHG